MELFIAWSMRIVSAALILVGGYMIGNWLSKRIKGIEQLDDTLAGFLGGFAKYAVFTVALVTVLGQFGIQTASLLAVLGAAGLAIGLALQGTLSNVAAGVMMLLIRPFNVGDFIDFGGTSGTVKTLGLFGTELAAADNVYIYAPNSEIWNKTLCNYSRNPERRQDIVVGISYNDDIDQAFDTINKVLSSETRLMGGEGKEPQIMVSNMGDFSIDITIRIWSAREDYWGIRFDLTKALKEGLEQDGITIPFPTSTVEMIGNGNQAQQKAA